MDLKMNVYNLKAEKVKDIELPVSIFGLPTNEVLVHQAMVAQMGNERQILAHTKDRSEVRGGGRKPWRQKGTGRARAGSSRSPIWIGGGVTFGPRKDRNFKKQINKKMRRKAMNMVLTDKLKENNILILDKLEAKEYKTKEMLKVIENFEAKKLIKARELKKQKGQKKKVNNKRSILFINSDKNNKKTEYSLRNLPGVKMINVENINILDLLKYHNVIFTVDFVEKMTILTKTSPKTAQKKK